MRKAIKNYADPTAAAIASDAVTYTVNKNAVKDAAASYELKEPTAEQLENLTAAAKSESSKKSSGSKTSGKSKKAIYIAVVVVAVVAAIFIIREN